MIGQVDITPVPTSKNLRLQDMNRLRVLPCLDSPELAEARLRELDIPRNVAADLGRSAVDDARAGVYANELGQNVLWGAAVQFACASKLSIPPLYPLPTGERVSFSETQIQVANETTLGASRRFVGLGLRPLALNYANGVKPGGGFRGEARAQEEVLCRSSALFLTLEGDLMYEEHRKRTDPDSTEWTILSPDVPVFRNDDGSRLEQPWLLSFITCAAPYAPTIGQPGSGDMLQRRIHRLLAIARAYDYTALVLGAWGCGAFGNDPQRTARDFRQALENEFRDVFSNIVFAITDWSPERRFLGPFRDTFSAAPTARLNA